METRHGPTMPHIARVCLIRMRPCPAGTAAACARTCRPGRLPDWRNLEAPPPAGTAARSVVFGTAPRLGRIATTACRALAHPGAEAPCAGEDSAAVAVSAGAMVAAVATAVVA